MADCEDWSNHRISRLVNLRFRPRGSGKPWRKIFVVVEGIYSMEGTFSDFMAPRAEGTMPLVWASCLSAIGW